MNRPTRIRLIAAGAALAVLAGGMLAAPRPPTLSTSATGDTTLAQRLADKAALEPGAGDAPRDIGELVGESIEISVGAADHLARAGALVGVERLPVFCLGVMSC